MNLTASVPPLWSVIVTWHIAIAGKRASPGLVNSELQDEQWGGYTSHCLRSLERVNRATWVEKADASSFPLLLLSSRFLSSTFLPCTLARLRCYIDIRPRTRSARTTRYCNVQETGLWMCTLLAFSLVHTRSPTDRDVSSRCEKGDRRWRRLILPRAGLFRKAKDDKGQSEICTREWSAKKGEKRRDRSFIPSLAPVDPGRNDYV